MTYTIEILGHVYTGTGTSGTEVIAETYDDGTQLLIGPVTSNLAEESRAMFVKRGKRGGTYSINLTVKLSEISETILRLTDAKRHLQAIASYRQDRWGTNGEGD